MTSRQRPSDPEFAEEAKFQSSIERNSNFRPQAANHNLGRNVRVVKLLGYIALLRRFDLVSVSAVEVRAAKQQNFSSGDGITVMGLPAGPMEAAHFLPGQVWIGGRLIWEFASQNRTRHHIKYLFGDVEHLPTPFNQADTQAEAKGEPGGLCEALATACRTMMAPIAGASANGLTAIQLVDAFDKWTRGAIAAFTAAIEKKSAKGTLPPLVGNRFGNHIDGYTPESIAARGNAVAADLNRDAAVRILNYYLEDQQQYTPAWLTTRCQSALKEVEYWCRGSA